MCSSRCSASTRQRSSARWYRSASKEAVIEVPGAMPSGGKLTQKTDSETLTATATRTLFANQFVADSLPV